MQLIVDSEAALDIKRDMSAIEDIHTEKVVNGDIEQRLNKNCNGNKENIEEFNVITNDEKNKHVLNSEIEALPKLPIDVKTENTEGESSIEIANKEETCESILPETNGKQNGEFQSDGTDEEFQRIIGVIKKEDEEEPEETVQENIVEDEEDIVSLKQEPYDQISVISDEIKISEDLSGTKDNVEDLKKQTETQTTTGSIPDAVSDVKLEEQTNVIKIDENSLECSDNEDIPKESCDNENITRESCDNEDIPKKSCGNEDITEESCDNEDIPKDSCENEGIPKESCDNEDITEESCDNKDIPKESCDNEDITKESCKNEDTTKETTENKEKTIEIEVTVDDSIKGLSNNNSGDFPPIELKDDMDVEEVIETKKSEEQKTASQAKETPSAPVSSIKPILCKLSNTLDILSDDEEETLVEETPKVVEDISDKQCINIEDDDDIMLIDEDTSKTETPETVDISKKDDAPLKPEDKTDSETGEVKVEETIDLFTKTESKDETQPGEIKDDSLQISVSEKQKDEVTNNFSPELPLLPNNFLNSAKNNLSDMTREELEEFCILKIVESIVDRSNLSEIKNKLKTVAQGVDEYRKKVMMLTKQNRDLQVVLKSIQEEQKKSPAGTPITPLKITRSVGMQVFMEKTGARRKNLAQLQNPNNTRQGTKSLPGTNPRPQKPPASTQTIPVPRLVPASPAIKSPSTIPLVNQITPTKPAAALQNGMKPPSPSQKVAEKRQFNRTMSVTVDLTDDEPPAKVNNRTSPAPPIRVVSSQTLMANQRQPFPTAVSSPRKVYIPISGPQNQNIRSGQTIMLKTAPTPGIRPRGPTSQVIRQPTSSVIMNRAQANRHPAPLPDAMKQYQPPNWKALPPAPDLKLSKVENGIVISWKLEGYQKDSYEEIASYQIYAYQDTSCPPSTSLWKKIGDVKALPLPMACTLTQFMAGYKYFFAVRAVDIRSRLGPFSLPGSILLLNKL